MGTPQIPHADFDAPAEGAAKPKPSCTFKLGGKKWSCRQPDDVPFAVIKQLVLGNDQVAAEEVVELAPDATPEEVAAHAEAVKQAKTARETVTRVDFFFQSTLVPEEVTDFMTMIEKPEIHGLTLGNLKPIMDYVTEHVLKRPTKRPAPSRARPRATKPRSAVA